MKPSVRVISKLEIKGPNLLKGLEFDGLRVLGNAWDFSKKYYDEGIDELIYQDVVASLYRRNSLLEIVKKTSESLFIPLTVGGGLRSVEDVREVLRAGADKVAINTAAVSSSSLIRGIANVFGSQCVVASLEVYQQANGSLEVWTDYGKERTRINAIEWACELEKMGAGEILVSSIERDGKGTGYNLKLIEELTNAVKIPIIAASGAGSKDDLLDPLKAGADAICASSIFHYYYCEYSGNKIETHREARLRMGEHLDSGNTDFLHFGYGGDRQIIVDPCSIKEAKYFLRDSGVEVRL